MKEALRVSQGSIGQHFQGVYNSTIGILFFGTPHRGADPRSFIHNILTISAKSISFKVNQDIINALTPHSERLEVLRDDFSKMCHNRQWIVYSFQEEYPVAKLLGHKVVDTHSSYLDDPTVETRQPISSDHMGMCRFQGLQDAEYCKVAAAVTYIIGAKAVGTPVPQSISVSRRLLNENLKAPDANYLGIKQNDTSHGMSHQGHSTEDTIPLATREKMIERLYFPEIDRRITHLAPAQRKTCHWFLGKPEYRLWFDGGGNQHEGHDGFLWIKGSPGTGKSTLMKFLFEEAKVRLLGDPSHILSSFFFVARGTVDERSTTGLYRSILHQLFRKAYELQQCFGWMTEAGGEGIAINGWSDGALKQALRDCVGRLGSRTVIVYVDALDECNDVEALDMVSFFEELCALSRQAHCRLQVCLSSRHYPHIEATKGVTIILEHESGHVDDIKSHIEVTLRLSVAPRAEVIRSELLKRSSGIFLWVVLIVRILNASEYPGRPIEDTLKQLVEILSELAELFEMILSRDNKNVEMTQICLEWILFARRPLSPLELYFAVRVRIRGQCLDAWSQDITPEAARFFASSCSKGLAEVIHRGDTHAYQVQFIHESVRDYLLDKYNRVMRQERAPNFRGLAHEKLKRRCLSQLNAAFKHLPRLRAMRGCRFPGWPNGNETRFGVPIFPFLIYAYTNILYHANLAHIKSFDQNAFLNQFPLNVWIGIGADTHGRRIDSYHQGDTRHLPLRSCS